MKIAVYGLPQSGKDTFIKNIITMNEDMYFMHIKTVSGSEKIADQTTGAAFSDSDTGILTDRYYSFPLLEKNDLSFSQALKTVFTQSELETYDFFIYLIADPEIILARMQQSETNAIFKTLSISEITLWQNFEIANLKEQCFCHNKELLIIPNTTESAVRDFNQFFRVFMHTYPVMTSLSTAAGITEALIKSYPHLTEIALFDCDRTVSGLDMTIPFIKANNLSENDLKSIFYNEAYSPYQFWTANELYKNLHEIDINDIDSQIKHSFNPIIRNKIDLLKRENYVICGITSGVFSLWNKINTKYVLFDYLIGTRELNGNTYIVSDFVKGYTAKLLKNKNIRIFACGDSMVDIYMLEAADDGFIYAPGKIRNSIQKYIDTHPDTSIKQFEANPYKYAGIKTE